MSKIVIITRDGEYIGNEALVNKLSTKKRHSSDCFYSFESFCENFYRKNEQGQYTTIDIKLLHEKLVEHNLPKDIIEDYIIKKRDWFNGEETPLNLAIDDSLVELFKKTVDTERKQCQYMEMIDYDNINKIYLFYWNRTKKIVTETWRMLALICKDCGIDFANSEEEKNLLYIHDDEWGPTGNDLLIQDGVVMSKSNKELLEQIKTKFTYAASFQHNKVEGTFFWDILHCNFVKRPPLSNLFGEKEKESTTFGDLKKACINVIMENSEK